ncbi:hypothetical protein M2281_005122 [Mesorhizobium soli]|uniref:hypothetical protein n=1 Tax=Pseudaminobacter soli (ex Li et al. 2025) TaxID=1295366 RepID=UPI002476F2F7|nr:hypothetical protein [Mesorhizobium soli]MDH6234504.1 hypothetical protein [Mesorhizobium soli]
MIWHDLGVATSRHQDRRHHPMNPTLSIRVIVLVILIATLAIGSALLIRRNGNVVDAISPCEQWLNPRCDQ